MSKELELMARESDAEFARLTGIIFDLTKALTEIAKGEGRYSSDPFTHARNTIDDMKQLALDALVSVSGEKQP